MPPFVSDSFTDTDTVSLTTHVGETGATWTKPGGTGLADIYGNRVRPTSGSARFKASGPPETAAYEITADFYAAAGLVSDVTGICARLVADGSDYVEAKYSSGSGVWSLAEVIDGGGSGVTWADSGMKTSGTTRAVKLRVYGTKAQLYIDGTLRLTKTLTTLLSAGSPGIVTAGASNLHLDNFVANPLDAVDVSFDTVVDASVSEATSFDTSTAVSAPESASFDTQVSFPVFSFVSGPSLVDFSVRPLRPARTVRSLPQVNERSSAGDLFVYTKGSKKPTVYELTIPRLDQATVDALLLFHRSTVRGVALPFTWTDIDGTQRTVRFVERELPIEPTGNGRCRVTVRLEELA